MLIDLSLSLTPDHYAQINQMAEREGHVGTHFDVMDKEFPIESFKTQAKLVDISGIRGREIEVSDLSGFDFTDGDMAIFYTGYIEEYLYDSPDYYKKSAELSDEAVAYLVSAGVRLIAVDAAGVQKPRKHQAIDQYCADRNVFIVENVANLNRLRDAGVKTFTAYTAPLKRTGLTGLPCRLIAEVSAAI